MSQEDRETEQPKGARERVGEGIRSGIGILSALRDALEESIQEARERGDLSTDRAKELVREAVNKAQAAASGARDRLDFVTHTELEALEATIASLGERVAALEGRVRGAGTEEHRQEDAQEGA